MRVSSSCVGAHVSAALSNTDTTKEKYMSFLTLRESVLAFHSCDSPQNEGWDEERNERCDEK